MIFPSITEYRDALLFEGALKKYSKLKLVTDANGQPCFSSGNFSVVFRMKDKFSGKEYAVKCFTRDQERRQISYKLISKYLEKNRNQYFVDYEYLSDEIWVNSKLAGAGEFPAVIMEWVESITLGEKLSELCINEDKNALFEFACAFDKMAYWLINQPFAHGDLKPDNILIKPNGAIRLIDYDGMFTSEMSGEPARENGSPGFRHPKRNINLFGPYIDDFSVLIISLSLHILAKEPNLNKAKNFGDFIIFDEVSLSKPGISSNWEEVERLRKYTEISQRLVMLYLAIGNPPETELVGIKSILLPTAVIAKQPKTTFNFLYKQTNFMPYHGNHYFREGNNLWRLKGHLVLQVSNPLFGGIIVDSTNSVYLKIWKRPDSLTSPCFVQIPPYMQNETIFSLALVEATENLIFEIMGISNFLEKGDDFLLIDIKL